MVSYSQNGEDVILKRAFPEGRTGFYIDIGASHPQKLSVTKHFYDRGWRGINVEPLKRNFDLFINDRPRDVNLNVAVGNESGSREFFEVSDYSELSTFSAEYATNLARSGHQIRSYPVPVITGNELFAAYVDGPVDFLKIDVEGNEYEVVSSIDFLRYRPRVLVIEATIPNCGFPGWNNFASILDFEKWEPMVLQSRYHFAYFDGLNRFYVRDEDRDLLSCFHIGLSLWDNFVEHELDEKLRESEADRAARLDVINDLAGKLRESESDRTALLDKWRRLENSLLVRLARRFGLIKSPFTALIED